MGQCDGKKDVSKSSQNKIAIGAVGIFGGIGGVVFGGMIIFFSFIASIISSMVGTVLLWLGIIIVVLGLFNILIGTGNSVASVVTAVKKLKKK